MCKHDELQSKELLAAIIKKNKYLKKIKFLARMEVER